MAKNMADEPPCITACGGEVQSERYKHSAETCNAYTRAAIPGFYTIQNVRGNV